MNLIVVQSAKASRLFPRCVVAAYSSTPSVMGKRYDRRAPKELPSHMKGIDGKTVRMERRVKRLKSLVKKELTNDLKSRARSIHAMESMVQSLFEEYGFTLHERPGHQTIKLHKQYSYKTIDNETGKSIISLQNISIEFDAYDEENGANISDQPIFLCDVLVSEEKPDKSNPQKEATIAFTCSPDRPENSQILSVRYVPNGKSHLDQKLYDGPALDQPHLWDESQLQGAFDMNDDDDDDDDENDDYDMKSLGNLSKELEERLHSSNASTIPGLEGLDIKEAFYDKTAEGSKEGAIVGSESSHADYSDADMKMQEEDFTAPASRQGLHKVARSLHTYLKERGVEPRSLAMARMYATHKYKQERQAGMLFMLNFLNK